MNDLHCVHCMNRCAIHEKYPRVSSGVSIYMIVFHRDNQKPSHRGEGVDQRETDEGTTIPTDDGFGETGRLPRIEEKYYTLC